MCRERYELNPTGEALIEELERKGITLPRIQQARACINAAAVRAGNRGERSRAVFAAVSGVSLPTFSLPQLDDWRLLMSHHYRTLPGLENAERNVLRFARAHYAVLSSRALETEHLLRPDTMQVCHCLGARRRLQVTVACMCDASVCTRGAACPQQIVLVHSQVKHTYL